MPQGTWSMAPSLWNDPITEDPRLNDVEVWEIYNGTEDAHPIHLHLVAFQVLSRQGFTAEVTEKEMSDMGHVVATGGILTNIALTGQPSAAGGQRGRLEGHGHHEPRRGHPHHRSSSTARGSTSGTATSSRTRTTR